MRAFVETVVPGASVLASCLVAPLLFGGLGPSPADLCSVGLAVALGLVCPDAADCRR